MRAKIAVLAVLAMFMLAAGFTTHAQEEAEPTVWALETKIAELEGQLTAIAQHFGGGTPSAAATAEVGDFSLTFTSAERKTELGESSEPPTPKGVYVLVHFTAINNGLKPAWIPSQTFILTDDRDRTFTLDNFAMGYLSFDYDTMENLQPGIPYESIVVYDVPEDATGLKLVIENVGFEYPLGLP